MTMFDPPAFNPFLSVCPHETFFKAYGAFIALRQLQMVLDVATPEDQEFLWHTTDCIKDAFCRSVDAFVAGVEVTGPVESDDEEEVSS